MIQHIIRFSVKNKLVVAIAVIALVIAGVYSMFKLPLDAVPDITNNQVQIVTVSSSLAPQEVEQFITFPVENAMANIPGVEEVRSISRFGLSVVTVIFEDDVPILEARQFVKEQIDIASKEIDPALGTPEMMPITTGLGEIYQYVLQVDSNYRDIYSPTELRTIQDWIVKKQLMGVKGIIDVSSFGGFLKKYEVAIDPLRMQAQDVTMDEVFAALSNNNQNSGGSYIEQGENAFYIRMEGLVSELADIERIAIKDNEGRPVLIRDIGSVDFGSPPRYGAMTMDGNGEAVGGITLMLKGSNSSEVIDRVKERIDRIQASLPKGVHIYPYLDRSVLVNKTIHTVSKNLIEGGLIVIFVLVLLLGNFRAGMIVASVIPLSLLFAFILMRSFGVSANLMSLGAIDFGIVIDGAVIVVEGVIHYIFSKYQGRTLKQGEMDDVIINSASKIIGSAIFGVLIIIVVFVPIMTLTGIEGKMFSPMAQTVSFAIIGALLLSITYVPMMSALILKKEIRAHRSFSDRLVEWIQSAYKPTLQKVLNYPKMVIGVAFGMLIAAVLLFNSLGAEFVPTLEEGDLAMQVTIPPGSSLTHMIETTSEAERILKSQFPEVKHVVSKIGTAEIPTDPMAVEDADVMILLKDQSEWTSADNREDLADLMKKSLEKISWAQFDFTQPIELRFNELISGSKSDVAVKLFGEDLEELSHIGEKIAAVIKKVPGAGDVKLEQTEGLPQIMIRYNREKLAIHQLTIDQVNQVIRAAYAGEDVGTVYEGQRRFPLSVRLEDEFRQQVNLGQLFVHTASGEVIPLSEVASIHMESGPMQVSRENAQRRISVGVNVRNRDLAGFVEEVQRKLEAQIKLPAGYYLEYGGQFENLQAAKVRLAIAVPIALLMILVLLYFTFRSMRYALLIYVTVPLATVGGVLALVLRGMPFSISAGVGFIALFGVAVLNGIVLITYFNRLREEGNKDLRSVVLEGSLLRLRPVLMTAAVASLGFLPMAVATSAGAEVQKPLATVVIGGLISATLLTLLVLPVLYVLSHRKGRKKKPKTAVAATLLLFLLPGFGRAQELSMERAMDAALQNNLVLKEIQRDQRLNKLDQRSAFSPGEFSLNYQHGQMNTEAQDYYVEGDQDLGNLLAMIRAKQTANAVGDQLESAYDIAVREVKFETRKAWANWVYAQAMIDLLTTQRDLLNVHVQQMDLKRKSGDISEMEYSLASLEQAGLQQKIHDWTLTKEVCIRNLEKWMGTGLSGTAPSWENLINDGLTIAELTAPDSTLLAPLHLELVALQKERQGARAIWFPSLSLGYFNQSIDHVNNYQGLKVGVRIPLFDFSRQREAQRAQARIDFQEERIRYENEQLDLSYASVKRSYEQALEIREDFGRTWLLEAERLQKAAEAEYNEGDVNYYLYLQSRLKIAEIQGLSLQVDLDSILAQYELLYYLNK